MSFFATATQASLALGMFEKQLQRVAISPGCRPKQLLGRRLPAAGNDHRRLGHDKAARACIAQKS
jgi:hypothetical protein